VDFRVYLARGLQRNHPKAPSHERGLPAPSESLPRCPTAGCGIRAAVKLTGVRQQPPEEQPSVF